MRLIDADKMALAESAVYMAAQEIITDPRRIYPKDYGHESLVCCQQNVDRLSIIGNIHDNPELLED